MAFFRGPNVVTNGLVLALDAANTKSYPGSGTVWNDLSGNNNSGSLINGPTFSSANGGSIVFDGTNNYVAINAPTNIQSQNFSVSVWINPLAPVNAITTIIDYDHASTLVQGWVLQSEDATTNRYYYFGYYDGTAFQPTTGIGVGKGIQITNSIWQNIIYVKSGTSLIGYLNGIQSVNYTAGNATVSYQAGKNLRIGGVISTTVGNRYYKGNIPQAQIYNRALSADEISQNYNAVKSRFNL
jgi:Concanavalin A-like lectin/glucanases superfamily